MHYCRYEVHSSFKFQEQVDILDDIPYDIYCDLVDTLNDKCLESSILEIWKYDYEAISSLTYEDIIEAVNMIKQSPIFGHDVDYTDLLGEKVYDESGNVIGKYLKPSWVEFRITGFVDGVA